MCAPPPRGIPPQGPPLPGVQPPSSGGKRPPEYGCRPGVATWPRCMGGAPRELPCSGEKCIPRYVPTELRMIPPPGMMR